MIRALPCSVHEVHVHKSAVLQVVLSFRLCGRGQGSLLRATASTGMNKRSSRSHAIFTITLEQRRTPPRPPSGGAGRGDEDGGAGDSGDEEDGRRGGLPVRQDAPGGPGGCSQTLT